ncbi:MAG: PorV/PorQ family protein [Bacteroidetes bacterium]|nr:PorV/PorQ family protein [Bacteroidota bacterium]
MFNRKIIIAVINLIVCGVLFGQSVSKTGTTAAKFLSIGVGARANAMGAASSSTVDDASSMYWNPAGIASINKYQGIFTYTKMFADINLNYFGVVIPAGEFGNIGVNVTAINYGDMDVTTELNPEGTGATFNAGSYAFGLTYARNITEEFIVGANVKYIRESIYNSSAEGVAVDIGTIFTTPFYGIKFASSITNFGTKMQISGDDLLVRYDQNPNSSGNNETVDAMLATEKYELPLRLQIGISRDFYFLNNQRLTLAVDANYPNDNQQWVNVGGELSLFNELIELRGGYKTIFLEDAQEGLTAGIGINYKNMGPLDISVDYAFQKYEYLDDVHSFGVILSF